MVEPTSQPSGWWTLRMSLFRYGTAWSGKASMVWYNTVRIRLNSDHTKELCLECLNMVRPNIARLVWYSLIWLVRYGLASMVWQCMVWYGMVWCDSVWSGMSSMVWTQCHPGGCSGVDPRRDLAQEGQPLQWQDHQGRKGPPTPSRLLLPFIHLPPSVRPWPCLGLLPYARPLPSPGLSPWHNSRLDPTLSFLYIFMGWLIAIQLFLF